MLETLNNIDLLLFLLINKAAANPVTDFIMPIFTSDHLLRIGYAVAMVLCLWKGNARLRWFVLFSLLTLAITDQLSAGILKPYFARPRPCHVLEHINLLVDCGGGMSLPSSHAANAFGQAILFGIAYRKVRYPLFWFAFLVAISRVFVGVHYPGDVLLGSLVGSLCAVVVYGIYRYVQKRITPRSEAVEEPAAKTGSDADVESEEATKDAD